jgi:hypothetical protein
VDRDGDRGRGGDKETDPLNVKNAGKFRSNLVMYQAPINKNFCGVSGPIG